MVKCKYEGNGIWNGRCTGTKEVDPCPGYDKCKQYKPNYTTNADRIRAMSDEELANWLARTQYANMMEAAEIFGTKLPFKEETLKGSEKECLEWLQQLADEE